MRSPVSSSVRGSILSGLADAVAEAGTRTTLPVLVTSPELRARGAAVAAGRLPQSLPAHGAVIVFDVVPAGSWASPGVAYRVERQGNDFRFENVQNRTATFDRAWAVARSVWRPAA